MTPLTWPCPLPGGGTAGEYALAFDRARATRLLVVPALFDEANRLRRFTVEVMRRLDVAGIDTLLPDLPGTNESLQSLDRQEPSHWVRATAAAAAHFGATHVLGLRGGCLFVPPGLPALHYAPVAGGDLLRPMLRARIVAAREAGRAERGEALMSLARAEGIELAGHRLSAAFVQALETMSPPAGAVAILAQGSPLWRRAEPDDDAAQAEALATATMAAIA